MVKDPMAKFGELVQGIVKAKTTKRRRQDFADALLELVELAKEYLPFTVVNMYRTHADKGWRSSPPRPFQSSEVAYMLGTIDGSAYCYHRGMLYKYPSKLEIAIPPVDVVSKDDITEDIVHALIENIDVAVSSHKSPEARISSGFFIFRYSVRLKDGSQKREEIDVVIAAYELESARKALQGCEPALEHSLDSMENLRVYCDGAWKLVKSVPVLGDIQGIRKITGSMPMILEIRE